MADLTDQQASDMGVEAAQLLANPAFAFAMQLMREDVYASFKACPIRDAEGLRLLAQVARLTDKFDGIVRGLVERGKLADHEIDRAVDGVRFEEDDQGNTVRRMPVRRRRTR